MKRRVVITGVGVLTPVGNDPDTFWQSILAGKSGAGKLTRFDGSEFTSRVAGEIKNFDPTGIIDPKEARRLDLFSQYAIVAATQACERAGIEKGCFKPDRGGVIIASGIGGIETLLTQYRTLLERGARKVSPFLIPMMISDIAPALVSIRYNLRGPNYAITSACASGAHAIGECFTMVRDGRVDVMVAGGTEAPIHPLAYAGFCAARALTTRNDDPEHASRPFDRDRDGFLISEGAGIVILEELESAKSRGVEILAEMIGYAATGDAFHITAPHEEGLGAMESMNKAIQDAQITTEDVDYINTHGTSTIAGDIGECKAIAGLFGKDHSKPMINSTKSMLGHMLGAAGAAELVATIMTLRSGWIHPSTNIENIEEACKKLAIVQEKIEAKPRIALSNSFGFGGHNATLIIRRWEE